MTTPPRIPLVNSTIDPLTFFRAVGVALHEVLIRGAQMSIGSGFTVHRCSHIMVVTSTNTGKKNRVSILLLTYTS